MHSNKTKYAILTFFTILLISFSAAEYEIDILGEEANQEVVMPDQVTQQFVNVTEGGEPKADSTLRNRNKIMVYSHSGEGEYTETGSETAREEWNATTEYGGGVFYAEFMPEPDEENQDRVEFAILDLDEERVEPVETQTIEVSEDTINLERFPEDPIRAEKPDQIIEVEVLNEDGQVQDDTQVGDPQLRFSRMTDVEDKGRLGYEDGTFSRDFTTPEMAETTYLTQIIVPGEEEGEIVTSKSFFMETKPPLEGELMQFEAQEGCNKRNLEDDIIQNNDLESSCEGNATIDASYEILESEAEGVNLTLSLYNRSMSDWEEVEEHAMDEADEGIWNTAFDFPFVDSNYYDETEGVHVSIDAWSDTREDSEEGLIAYNALTSPEIDFSPSGGDISQGQSLEAEFDIRRPYTNTNLDEEEYDSLNVTVTDPDGAQYENFSIEDLENDGGIFRSHIETSTDTQPGTYTLDVEAEDTYGATSWSSRDFNIDDLVQTFSIDPMEFEIDKKGIHQEIVNITNEAEDDDLTIYADIPDEINNTLIIEDHSDISVDNPYSEYPIEINMTEIDSVEDEVTFYDSNSNYNQTVDFSVETPTCNFQDNNLCSKTGESIREESDELGTSVRDFEVLYIGEPHNTSIDISVDGNISEYISYNQEWNGHTLNQTHDNATIPIEYSYDQPGYFEGNITIEGDNSELEYQTSMNSTVPPQNLEFDLDPEDYQSEEILEGDDHTFDLEITNTGDLRIDEITATSDDYSVSISSNNIELGSNEEETIEVTMDEVNQESGEISIEASTDDETGSQTVNIEFEEVLEDYGESISQLSDDLDLLEGQDSGSVATEEISQARQDLDEAKIMWDDQDYDEAIRYFDDAEAQYSAAEEAIEQDEQQSQEPDEGTGGDTGNGSQEQQEEGGLPIIPIFAGLLIVFLVGFVAYSSIIPEQGDPLYDVLGV